MSRTTRVRIVSSTVLKALTTVRAALTEAGPTMSCTPVGPPRTPDVARSQALLAVNADALREWGASLAAGGTLSSDEAALVSTTNQVMTGSQEFVSNLSALADQVAIEQRTIIASTVRSTLEESGWTVHAVPGVEADQYTGIEATRGSEHFVAGVVANEVIADQAGAHDCRETVSMLAAALQVVGSNVAVVDDVEHDGTGGALYALEGGPTLAHAIQASLRRSPLKLCTTSRVTSAPAAIVSRASS
jgi:hypothetical protein